MTEEDLVAIEARAQAATPGPWRWNLNLKSKCVTLEALITGYEVVMDFVRWGMNGAKVRFQKDGLMKDAESFAQVAPGRSHHAGWYQTLSHPDAVFIEKARQDIPVLLFEVRRLKERLAQVGIQDS